MGASFGPGSRPTDQAPSGPAAPRVDPSREAVLEAAADIQAMAKAHPELFDVKTRAMGIWKRLLFWSGGILIGTTADHCLRGHTGDPVPILVGMMFAVAFVYFDPPPVRTIYTLRKRDTDRSGEADETPQAAQPEARAGAEGIAQAPSQAGWVRRRRGG